MTATALVTPRPRLIDRLLNWWFALPPSSTSAETGAEPRQDVTEDLRTALEAASMCQVSALSAEYAHYLIDRHSGRYDGRLGARG